MSDVLVDCAGLLMWLLLHVGIGILIKESWEADLRLIAMMMAGVLCVLALIDAAMLTG